MTHIGIFRFLDDIIRHYISMIWNVNDDKIYIEGMCYSILL